MEELEFSEKFKLVFLNASGINYILVLGDVSYKYIEARQESIFEGEYVDSKHTKNLKVMFAVPEFIDWIKSEQNVKKFEKGLLLKTTIDLKNNPSNTPISNKLYASLENTVSIESTEKSISAIYEYKDTKAEIGKYDAYYAALASFLKIEDFEFSSEDLKDLVEQVKERRKYLKEAINQVNPEKLKVAFKYICTRKELYISLANRKLEVNSSIFERIKKAIDMNMNIILEEFKLYLNTVDNISKIHTNMIIGGDDLDDYFDTLNAIQASLDKSYYDRKLLIPKLGNSTDEVYEKIISSVDCEKHKFNNGLEYIILNYTDLVNLGKIFNYGENYSITSRAVFITE